MKNEFFSYIIDTVENTETMIELGYECIGKPFKKNSQAYQAFVTNSIESSDAYDQWILIQKQAELLSRS